MSSNLDPQKTLSSYVIAALSGSMLIKVPTPSSHHMSQQFWSKQLGRSWILMNAPLTT